MLLALTLLTECKITAFFSNNQTLNYVLRHKSTYSLKAITDFQYVTFRSAQKKVRTKYAHFVVSDGCLLRFCRLPLP